MSLFRVLVSRLWRRGVRRPLGVVLHPLRRRAAIRRLERLDGVTSILFVCHGNICRSPYAAGALRRDLPENTRLGVRIECAGFAGPGRLSPGAAVTTAAKRGVDLAGHRSQVVDRELVRAADLVVVMDANQRRAITQRFEAARQRVMILADLLPGFYDGRQIPDPIDEPLQAYERAYSLIDQSVATLGSVLIRGR